MVSDEKMESSIRLTKSGHWDAWNGKVVAFCQNEEIQDYVIKSERITNQNWFKPPAPRTTNYRTELERIGGVVDSARQEREENILDYEVKADRKKYERKTRSLNVLKTWMKESAARIHLSILNKYTEAYQVYEFLESTYAPTNGPY